MECFFSRVVVGIVLQLTHFDVGSAQELKCVFIQAVGDVVDQPGDAGIDQSLGAVEAWKVSHITGAAAGGDAVQRCLDNGVGLCMDGAHAMSINE